MGRILSAEQVAAFERDGYVFPVEAMSAAEARALGRRIEDYERESGVDATAELRVKGHLVFPWLVELARHPAILDAVEDLLGPDLLVYLSTFWFKGAGDPSYVSWHQDSAYYGLDPHEAGVEARDFIEGLVEDPRFIRRLPFRLGRRTVGRASSERAYHSLLVHQFSIDCHGGLLKLVVGLSPLRAKQGAAGAALRPDRRRPTARLLDDRGVERTVAAPRYRPRSSPPVTFMTAPLIQSPLSSSR